MKVVFFGTSVFAVPMLEGIINSKHSVLAVVTQPDRKKGRLLNIAVPAVKEVALSKSLKVLQPEELDDAFTSELSKLASDIFVVIAYGHILKKHVLKIPKRYSINVHASLLPKYRGAAPINWAVMNGESKTGVTIIKINERMDEGDVLSHIETKIKKDDTSSTLSERLSKLGKELLIKTLDLIEEGKEKFEKQDSEKATYAKKLTKQSGLIDWNKGALEIHNKVRGVVPWPGAYTFFDGKKINIWQTSVLDGEGKSGEIVEVEGKTLIIGTGKGLLGVKEIQAEGKKRMGVEDFLRGYRTLKKGQVFKTKAS